MNMRSYLKRHLGSKLLSFIIISAICCLVCFVLSVGNQSHEYTRQTEFSYTVHVRYDPTLGMSVFVLCLMCIIAPVLEFQTFKHRKNLDFWYSMPISKRSLGFVHFFTGYLLVAIPFTACYVQNFIMLLLCGAAEELFLLPLIPFYFMCLLFGLVAYSVCAFVFNRASTVIDGVFTMLLWTSVFFVVTMGINNTMYSLWGATFYSEFVPNMWMFTPIIKLTTATHNTIMGYSIGSQLHAHLHNPNEFVHLIAWTVIGLAAAAGAVLTFGKQRVETVQEHSSSFFCYRTLIPIYAFSIMNSIGLSNGNLPFRVFISVIAFIGYIIYRRGFRFKLSDGIVMTLIGLYSGILEFFV